MVLRVYVVLNALLLESLVDAADKSANECYPWGGHTYYIYVNGWDGGYKLKFISFSDDATRWLYARYPRPEDAAPFLFQPVGGGVCNVYKLQNKWLGDDRWVSFTTDGKWLYATATEGDAMPIEFVKMDSGNNVWKMKNTYPGEGYWISYTDDDEEVRAIYDEGNAMKVGVWETDASKVHVVSVEACFNQKFANTGGGGGVKKQIVKITIGMTNSHSYTKEVKATFEKSASTTIKAAEFAPEATAGWKATLEGSLQAVYSDEETKSMEVTEEIDFNFDKPNYAYQPVVIYHMSDGGIVAQLGKTLLVTSSPLAKPCINFPVQATALLEMKTSVNSPVALIGADEPELARSGASTTLPTTATPVAPTPPGSETALMLNSSIVV